MTNEQLRKYFSYKYRGKYYGQVKLNAIVFLQNKGLTQEQIAEIIYGKPNNSLVSNALKKDFVELPHWKEWVRKGLYPVESKGIKLEKI